MTPKLALYLLVGLGVLGAVIAFPPRVSAGPLVIWVAYGWDTWGKRKKDPAPK